MANIKVPKGAGHMKLPKGCRLSSVNGGGRGYNVYLEKHGRALYTISDNINYDTVYQGSYDKALRIAKKLAKKQGQGATLFIDKCSEKKNGTFMFVGEQFVECKYLR